MNICKIETIFFSPTHSTENILSAMVKHLNIAAQAHDITPLSARDSQFDFNSDTLVIIGVPVYGGRIPAPAVQTLKNIHGKNTPAILIATYGNREYDDALLELKILAEESGLIPFAAAAFVTEHSIMHSVATGRPDASDHAIIADFTHKAWSALSQAPNADALQPVNVPGNSPFKEYGGVPLKPRASKLCIKCGACAKGCPTGAIKDLAPSRTNKSLCISCMRCIQICPTHARKLNRLMLSAAEAAFAAKNSKRREPELFL